MAISAELLHDASTGLTPMCPTHSGYGVEFLHVARRTLGCSRCLLDAAEPVSAWALIEDVLKPEAVALDATLQPLLTTPSPESFHQLIGVLDNVNEGELTQVDIDRCRRIFLCAAAVAESLRRVDSAIRPQAT